jgi:hypothetical protein
VRLLLQGRELDADFTLTPALQQEHFHLVVSAGGGGKNSEYAQLLQELLNRLCALQSTILSCTVISKPAMKLHPADRLIQLNTLEFPLPLDSSSDSNLIRKELSAGQKTIAQQKDAKGGNGTKRIQLDLLIPNFLITDADSLELTLANGGTDKPNRPKATIPKLEYGLLKVNPPKIRTPKAENDKPKHTRVGKKIDYLDQAKENQNIGDLGELLVVKNERDRLASMGLDDLADLVEHSSVQVGDGLGYDIRSFEETGEYRYIEVKTTTGAINTPFFMSQNERDFAVSHPNSYLLVRVFAFNKVTVSGQCFEMREEELSRLDFQIANYRVLI